MDNAANQHDADRNAADADRRNLYGLAKQKHCDRARHTKEGENDPRADQASPDDESQDDCKT